MLRDLCPTCGSEVLGPALFCPQCGSPQPGGQSPRRSHGPHPVLLVAGATAIALVAFVAGYQLARPVPIARTPEAVGTVRFGDSLGPGLAIQNARHEFDAARDRIAWRVDLPEPPRTEALRWTVMHDRDQTTVHTGTFAVENPELTVIGIAPRPVTDLVPLPGTYTVRYFRGAQLMAEGRFTVVR